MLTLRVVLDLALTVWGSAYVIKVPGLEYISVFLQVSGLDATHRELNQLGIHHFTRKIQKKH